MSKPVGLKDSFIKLPPLLNLPGFLAVTDVWCDILRQSWFIKSHLVESLKERCSFLAPVIVVCVCVCTYTHTRTYICIYILIFLFLKI